MIEYINQIILNPLQSIFLILNILLLEIILSFDNSALLALMVKELPKEQQNKALKYGIIGAYLFRGLMLILGVFIIHLWWIKPIGGIYLLYLSYNYFKNKSINEINSSITIKNKWLTKLKLNQFIITIISVELLDLSLSLDNVLAVIAYSNNIILICFGVFIGILSMRFLAKYFIKLIELYPFIETSAFIIIPILGLKLLLSIFSKFIPEMYWLENKNVDLGISICSLCILFIPILYTKINKNDK